MTNKEQYKLWQKLKKWLTKMQIKYGENATIRLKSMEKQMHIIELEMQE